MTDTFGSRLRTTACFRNRLHSTRVRASSEWTPLEILFFPRGTHRIAVRVTPPFQLHPGAALCQRLENTVSTNVFSSSGLRGLLKCLGFKK